MIKQRGILPDDSILAHIPDIYAYSKSDKFHWLQKVLDGSFESSWISLIQLRFPVLENNFIFNCNLKPENIENVPIKNKLWRDLLKYFFELKSKTTEPLQGDSIIWFNSLLKIEGKTLFYKELHDKGVTYLSDLVNENGRFKTIDEIWGQFNCRINCLNYFGLVSMIKSKHINFETKTTNPCPLINRIINSKSLSKEIYQQLMPSELDFDIIKGLSKWRSELETYIDFENVFGNISKITYDYKLQNFQYKLVHRILPTNTFLTKIGIKDSDLCSFC